MYVPLLAVIGFMLCRSAIGTADISSEKIVGREDYTVNIIPHGMATIPFFD